MDDDTILAIARRTAAIGREAFGAGKPCIPAHDPKLMAIVALSKGFGDPRTTAVLRAWSASWTAANLAAPIPGEEL